MPNLKRAIPFWGVTNRVGQYEHNNAATFVFSSMLGLGGALTAIYFTGGFKSAIQEEEQAYQFHNGLHHAAAGLVVGTAALVLFLIGCGPACCLTIKLNKAEHAKARLRGQLAAVSAARTRRRRRATLGGVGDGGTSSLLEDDLDDDDASDGDDGALRASYGTSAAPAAIAAHGDDVSDARSGPAARQGGISMRQRVLPICFGLCMMSILAGVPIALLATHDDLSKDWEAMTKWPFVHWLGVGIFSLLSTAVVGAMGVAIHACTGAMFCPKPMAPLDPYGDGDMYDSLSSDGERVDLGDAANIHAIRVGSSSDSG